MSLLGKLFGAKPAAPSDECVKLCVRLSDDEYGSAAERDAVHEFTDKLAAAIEEHHAGEFDGDEFGEGECMLFMYGPSADRLFDVIEPLLKGWEPLKGGYAIKRYGAPGSHSVRIDF
jgi:hypothetical protein